MSKRMIDQQTQQTAKQKPQDSMVSARLLTSLVKELEHYKTVEKNTTLKLKYLVRAVESLDQEETAQMLEDLIRVVTASDEHRTRQVIYNLCQMASEYEE